MVKVTEAALQLIGSNYKTLLTLHLRTKYHSGLEMVATRPHEFHEAVSTLFGEYSAKLLEGLIMEGMAKEIGTRFEETKDFQQFMRKMNKKD